MIRILILSATLLSASPAWAHKVIASVFPSGSDIEGEIGFSDGVMAVDAVIEVFDDMGVKLGETKTDQDGFFIFTPRQPVAHHFRADLGAGHIATAKLTGAEVAHLMGQDAAQSSAGASTFGGAPKAVALTRTDLSDQTRSEVATMLRDELRPLRQELSALKNKTSFQSLLGGIGYIFGVFGLGFYLAARRKLGDDT